MTREESIERLKMILGEATTDENAVCYVTSDDAGALDMAIKALEQNDFDAYWSSLWKSAYEKGKADAEQRWTPVTDRLPEIPDGEDWVRCLCYGEKEITPDHVDDSNTITRIEIVTYFRHYGWEGWFHPIAWMPLPESYTGQESEDKA